jgi:hypothetical protein
LEAAVADLSDVENALVAAITAAVYPNGTGTPPTYGAATKIYRGWPNARALDLDLAAGVVNISVFPKRGMTRNTTRWTRHVFDNPAGNPAATLSVTYTESTVTFAGGGTVTNLAGIRYKGAAYIILVPASDGATYAAAQLAAQIAGATASGGEVILPAASSDTLARVAGPSSVMRYTRRQIQEFSVVCWCSTPTQRDAVCGLVDDTLAAIDWIPLADSTMGWIKYVDTFVDDAPTKETLWRRDLFYSVEYSSTQTVPATRMLFGGVTLIPQLQGNGAVVNLGTLALSPQ